MHRDALHFILQPLGFEQFLVDPGKFAGPFVHQEFQFPFPPLQAAGNAIYMPGQP